MLTWGEFGEGVGDCCVFFVVTCLTSMNFYLMEKSNLCHVFYSFRFHLPWHWGCGMCSCWKETGCWPLWRIISWKCTEVSRIWLVYSPTDRLADWLLLQAVSEFPFATGSKESSSETSHMKMCFTYRFIFKYVKLIFLWISCTGLVLKQRHKVNLEMAF